MYAEALERIISLKMSAFRNPYDMIGEYVKIAAEALGLDKLEEETD